MSNSGDQIAVEREVRGALCRHDGLLGKLLALRERFDGDDAAGCDQLLSALPCHFDRHTLNTCLSAALRWLNGAATEPRLPSQPVTMATHRAITRDRRATTPSDATQLDENLRSMATPPRPQQPCRQQPCRQQQQRQARRLGHRCGTQRSQIDAARTVVDLPTVPAAIELVPIGKPLEVVAVRAAVSDDLELFAGVQQKVIERVQVEEAIVAQVQSSIDTEVIALQAGEIQIHHILGAIL